MQDKTEPKSHKPLGKQSTELAGKREGIRTLQAVEKHVVYQSKKSETQIAESRDPVSSSPSESRYVLAESKKLEEHYHKE